MSHFKFYSAPLCMLTFTGAMIALYLGRKPTLPKAQKVQKLV
ncbi:hypothetical protein RGU78_08650 [Acinetobacter baumannii]